VCEDKNESSIFHKTRLALCLVEGTTSWTFHLFLILGPSIAFLLLVLQTSKIWLAVGTYEKLQYFSRYRIVDLPLSDISPNRVIAQMSMGNNSAIPAIPITKIKIKIKLTNTQCKYPA
jgi:hypothetical protein